MKNALVIFCLVLVVPLSGCAVAVVAAGAGAGYVWVNGMLQETLSAPLPRVETATRAALQDLELVAIHGRADKLKGKIKAHMADGTKVVIWLKAVDFQTTNVKIRVGRVGDKAISLQILRHIKQRLGLA